MNPAYKETVFESVLRFFPDAFAIITAHNPEGLNCPQAVNESLNRDLLREIRAPAFDSFEIIGMSPDGVHREAGFGIVCPFEAAIQLGRKYKQEAIFRIEQDQLSLIDLKDLKAYSLGSFNARCTCPE